MKRLVILLAGVMIALGVHAQKVATPDFAFPKKVAEQSAVSLKAALKKGNGPGIVRSLMDKELAEVSIEPSRVSAQLEQIEGTRRQVNDSVTASMLDLLMADIIYNVYNSDRYKFDTRSLPATPVSADISEWSGEQFRNRLSELTTRAMANADLLKNVGIEKWNGVVTVDKSTLIYYPTLYDFAVTFVIKIEEAINAIGDVVPLKALSESIVTPELANADARRIVSYYDDLLQFHSGNSAPRINYTIRRLEFINKHVFGESSSSEEVWPRFNQIIMKMFDKEFPVTEFSGDLLLSLLTTVMTHEQIDQLYDLTGRFIKKYPAYLNMPDMERLRKELAKKRIEILYPSANLIVPSARPVTIVVGAENVSDGFLEISRVLSGDKIETIASFPVSVGDTVGSRGIVRIPFTFRADGRYRLATGVKQGKLSDERRIDVTAASILLANAETVSGKSLYALNPVDGEPMAGVEIFRSVKNSGSVSIGVTDENGRVTVGNEGVYFGKKGSLTSPEISVYFGGNGTSTDSYRARILTSLPLYHPGDSIEWTAVVYSQGPSGNRLTADKKFEVKLTDANGMTVETATVVTDSLGRIAGKFKLPDSGLQGYFSIILTDGSRYITQESVKVSDYKLPTFVIETEPVYFDGDEAVLRGCVRAYSGFNLPDTKVDVTVTALRSIWWNRADGSVFYTTTVTTDAAGKFSLRLSGRLLAGAPRPDGPFEVTYDVTSLSGESRTASVHFSRKPMLRVNADLDRNVDLSRPVNFDVRVLDAEGKPVDAELEYRLQQNDSTVRIGRFTVSHQSLDFSGLDQGRYNISIKPVASPADSITGTMVLYDLAVKASPVSDRVLWSPSSTLELGNSGKGKVLLAASAPTHVFYTLKAGNKIVDQRLIPFDAVKDSVEVSLPEGTERGLATFAAVADYSESLITITVTAPAARRKLVVKAESMRDRVVPGTPETWTVKVETTDNNTESAAVVLDMYNAAVDALTTSRFNLNLPGKYAPTIGWRFNVGGSWTPNYSVLSDQRIDTQDFRLFFLTTHYWNSQLDIVPPSFNTYGLSFVGRRYYSYPISVKGAAVMQSSRSVESNNVVEDMLAEADADSGSIAEEVPLTAEPFAYRDREVPLAFFKPMLTTGDDGRLTFSFTVPDANTTWRFNAVAFTRDLLSANFSADVTASKPVMVQPNLPRFVRSGDRVEIQALVMNNTDSRAEISTLIEIFDPATSQLITTERHTDLIDAFGSATVSIMVDAPFHSAMLGFRVKSSTATFADGEQALLPVLPAAQPVVSATPFFIPAGEKNFSITMPEISDNARVTLEYCENPAWAVVTALPGLYDNKFNTTIGAAHSLFAAAVSDGIVRTYPTVANALSRWTASDRSDSTLVSMLERNGDLKIAMLQATPWMMDARSDSERMDRLAMILSRRMIDTSVSGAIDLFQRCQVHGGGWNWTGTGDKADLWTTMMVLRMMGRLNQLGFLPKNESLRQMIGNAVRFVDAHIADRFRESPSGNYMDYVYMRDMFPEIRQSSAAERVTSATLQQITGRWGDLQPQAKAVAATILYHHNYVATARQILESLREYAVASPEQGMWWPSLAPDWWSVTTPAMTGFILEAFATVEPGCAEIEQICHWLVNRKMAQDWGDMISTSSLVATFLAAAPKWVTPAVAPVVRIGDETVTPANVERISGYFRTDVSELKPSGQRLSIDGAGTTPSWGALFVSDNRPMTEIEPSAVANLEISRSFLVVSPDGSVRNADGRLRTGDRMRVTLTIKARQSMDYVAVVDNRASCFEPVDQLPGYVYADGLSFYRVNADAATSLFITHLPAGTFVLSYDMQVNNAGVFTSGAATVQSQLSPSLTARSAGAVFAVD